MVSETEKSYRNIFKATSLFGGVQVYQILVQIIKSKFVAVLLGPAGVGMLGLYQSGLQLVQCLTNMGLASSAVRDVSEANGTNDTDKISKTVTVVRRLVWMTGMLGLLATVLFSPILSKTTFGNYDFTIPFALLSVTLLLDQLSAGQKVVLQGMRRLKDLAKCSAIGVTFGLAVSVPLYYWFGIRGIVPTLILNSVCSLLLSWLYSRKIKIEKRRFTTKETFRQGRMMLVMGISMSFNGIFTTAAAYIIKAFVQNTGGLDEVGLYQAGVLIMNTYVGMVLTAIGTDYYPRLAAINRDNAKCREAASQQGEIGAMILGPMLTFCLVFMPFILQLLYSDRFLKADEYISWACLGMMLRLAAWVISYMFVAKAESKLLVVNEGVSCAYNILFSILGYKLGGLSGIGVAFALLYAVYFAQVYLIARKRYDFRFSRTFVKTYAVQLLLLVICLALVLLVDGILKYILGILVIAVSTVVAVSGLNKRMHLFSALRQKRNK